MKIMLLAEDFPQVATRATKPSESLHWWSGPEKEKTIRSEKKKSIFSVGWAEEKLSVGLCRVT